MASSGLDLRINDKLEIIKGDKTYKCNVQDIKKNGILIDMATDSNYKYIFFAGDEITFKVYRDREVIKCKSTVLGFKREQNLLLAVINIPEILERVQRREFYRLPVIMPLKYVVLPDEADLRFPNQVIKEYSSSMESSVSVDLSGGGIRIITKEKAKYNSKIMLSLMIPDETFYFGVVVREETNNDLKQHKAGLKFVYMQERKRDKIINFIFSKLREQSNLLK